MIYFIILNGNQISLIFKTYYTNNYECSRNLILTNLLFFEFNKNYYLVCLIDFRFTSLFYLLQSKIDL